MPVIDYLILTPLDEEFNALQDVWPFELIETPQPVGICYRALHTHPIENRQALVVVASMGKMGQAWTAAFVNDAVRLWRPANTILVGIAGSLVGEELQLGDIIVPSNVVGYEIGEIVEDEAGSLDYKFRPTASQTSFSLLDSARSLCSNPKDYSEWRRAALDATAKEFRTLGIPERLPKIHIHANDQLATGNFVIKSKNFRNKIQPSLGNVNLRAVEMESQGLFEAIRPRNNSLTTSALIVRGISDYADKDKAHKDKNTGGVYRRAAARGAALFLAHLIDRRLQLEPGSAEATAPAILNLSPERDPISSCRQHGIELKKDGEQLAAFERLLDLQNGSSELTVTVTSHRDNMPVEDPRVSLMIVDKEGMHIPEPRRSGPAWNWSIGRRADPFRVSLAMSTLVPANSLSIAVRDEFGRQSERTHYFEI